MPIDLFNNLSAPLACSITANVIEIVCRTEVIPTKLFKAVIVTSDRDTKPALLNPFFTYTTCMDMLAAFRNRNSYLETYDASAPSLVPPTSAPSTPSATATILDLEYQELIRRRRSTRRTPPRQSQNERRAQQGHSTTPGSRTPQPQFAEFCTQNNYFRFVGIHRTTGAPFDEKLVAVLANNGGYVYCTSELHNSIFKWIMIGSGKYK